MGTIRPRGRLSLAGCLAAVALLGACGGALPDKGRIELAPTEPVTVSVLTALTGPLSAEGQGMVNAVTLAAEQHGAVRGHDIRVEPVDGGCDPRQAEAAATGVTRERGMIGLVGPVCSAACVAAEPILDDRTLVMITPRCTDVSVTRQGYEGVMRTAFTDAVEAAATARFAHDQLHVSDVFVVHDGTLYGRGLRDIFRIVYGKDNLAGNEQALIGTADFGQVVRAIKRSDAGLVYYAGFGEDAARFVRQLREAGVGLPVVLPEAVLESPDFAGTVGPFEGVYVTQSAPQPGRTNPSFAESYRRRFGAEPPPYAGEAFDAANILLGAVARTAETQDGRLVVDRRRLRNAVRDTDVQGVTGRVRFRENGDRYEGVAVRLYQVRDGRLVEERTITFDD